MASYTLDELARFIDHTNLHAYASADDIRILCNEALAWNFRMVAINQCQAGLCHELLKDSEVHVGAAISFPLGQTSIYSKVQDTHDAIECGADEIDYVVNLTEVKNKNWDYVREEMESIVALCHEGRGGGMRGASDPITCKVIFENCYLSDDEKIALCQIASDVRPDFIKTSTGFGTGGATLADVELMRSHVASEVKVKAAGGIRTADDFVGFLRAGAERVGTSAGVAIMEELAERLREQGTDTLTI